MSSRCGGCNRQFSGGGFLQHLRKTTNLACKSYGSRIYSNSAMTTDALATMLSDSSNTQNSFGAPQVAELMAVDSVGDLFRDYDELEENVDVITRDATSFSEKDVCQWSDSDSNDDGDEDEAGAAAECEYDWEPEILQSSEVSESRSPSPDLEGIPIDLYRPIVLPPSKPPPPSLPDCLRKPFIKPYSDPHAGAPLSTQTTILDGNDVYTEKIGHKGNIWAPFQSEIDWKVTKWAKLRGASSTAVTELLSIDGVSASTRG
ncbi:hypothetical protein K435DRAFT_877593 [Dendrothele bispora CBS 962.96]|uniref:Uncharacterized protein n=1 Tax=Dendrothele bispora (strain CBS 962.96) TaxID=1314807 RepID=A0A4S8KPZ6_DENBC|nr:hypothetical protein K435DRAFT_877593 [Dendrothele bispora CBS 962.96]